MYLSKLILNPDHAQARQDLTSPYELHRTLGRAFPSAETKRYRQECGVLFRVEPPTRQETAVLVQSTAKPDWSRLQNGYALRADGPKAVAPAIAEGQRLRFRLLANPVRRTREEGEDGKSRVRRVPLVHAGPNAAGHGTYWEWLERQGARCGFAVDREQTLDVPLGGGRRRAGSPSGKTAEGKRAQGHFGVRFDGVLEVTDDEALGAAVQQGIGPAKAYGFGLLSLAPAGPRGSA